MKECCGEVLYGEVLSGSVARKCGEEVLWRSVVKECCGELL